MNLLLQKNRKKSDVFDAGTTMRFLTAYLAVSGENKVITGSDRMKQRPIGPLVDALREIGAEIVYLENDGYPPPLDQLSGVHDAKSCQIHDDDRCLERHTGPEQQAGHEVDIAFDPDIRLRKIVTKVEKKVQRWRQRNIVRERHSAQKETRSADNRRIEPHAFAAP